jgi:putative transposase
MRVPLTDISCKFCGSRHVVRDGTHRGVQRVLCRDCGRKGALNDALPYMQTPVDQIGAAVSMFYEGQSLASVGRLMVQLYGSYPSDSAIYKWVSRFTKSGLEEIKDHKPHVGEEWVADETVLDIAGKKRWYWDIIDAKTRFLLASHLSTTRTTRDAQRLMELAAERAGHSPKIVLTDKLAAYLDGIELTFGADTKHITTKPFTVEQNTNLIERFHGTLKSRTKVMRGLKDIRTAKLVTDGWLLYYNYFRPHESLGGKTPAEMAGIKFPYRNWKDIVTKDSVVASEHSPKPIDPTIFERFERGEPSYTPSGFRLVPSRARRLPKRRMGQVNTRPSLSRIRS